MLDIFVSYSVDEFLGKVSYDYRVKLAFVIIGTEYGAALSTWNQLAQQGHGKGSRLFCLAAELSNDYPLELSENLLGFR